MGVVVKVGAGYEVAMQKMKVAVKVGVKCEVAMHKNVIGSQSGCGIQSGHA
jgi:hypothetical protein